MSGHEVESVEVRARRFWVSLGEDLGQERLDMLVAITVALAQASPVRREAEAEPEVVARHRKVVEFWNSPTAPPATTVAAEAGLNISSVYRHLREAEYNGELSRPLRRYDGREQVTR